jgi:Ger(x)C family germination protein
VFRKLGLLFIIGLQLITLAGCWDYNDINRVNFPLVASYDVNEETRTASSKEEQEELMLDLSTIIPDIDPNVKAKFRVEKTSGITIGANRGQKPYSFPGKYSPYLAGILVIGEDLSSMGLIKIFDPLVRGARFTSVQNLAVAEGRGESVINAPVEDYPTMGEFLRGLLRQSESRGFIPSTTMHQFQIAQVPGKNPIIPLMKAQDHQAEIIGTAIFRKDTMIAKANINETRSLMMLRGIKSTGNIPFIIKKDGDILDKGSVDLKNSRKVKVERKGDQISFQITINLAGNVVEHQFGNLFTKNKDLSKMIEDQIAADVKKDCEKFIRKMQEEYKVDCIDISKYALAKWEKELLDRVDMDFIENVTIQVNVKMKLVNVGELT